MHFEVLAEDKSGSIALEKFLKEILGPPDGPSHTWRIISYKGLGHLSKDLKPKTDPSKRILLDQLPDILRGYGKVKIPQYYQFAIIVVVDLDDRNCMQFKQELVDVLKNKCKPPRPETLFRIAIEESEAWLLGDRDAVKKAYPKAKDSVLNKYKQDSICGTWEVLADAVDPTATKLKYPRLGQKKCEWAEKIAPFLDVDKNRSKSFQVFRDGVRRLAGI